MKVENGNLVSVEYTLTTKQGELIESSVGKDEPLSFVYGSDVGLLPGFLEALEGMEENEEKEFDLPPEKAFGTVNSGPEMTLPTNVFPDNTKIEPGESFEGTIPDSDQVVKFVIREKLGDKVRVRLIHLYAEKTIHVQLKVLAVSDGPDLVEDDDDAGDEEKA